VARSAGLLGLRAPLNTAARLLNPFDARAGVDEVFHPAYIALHLAAAERLGAGAASCREGRERRGGAVASEGDDGALL